MSAPADLASQLPFAIFFSIRSPRGTQRTARHRLPRRAAQVPRSRRGSASPAAAQAWSWRPAVPRAARRNASPARSSKPKVSQPEEPRKSPGIGCCAFDRLSARRPPIGSRAAARPRAQRLHPARSDDRLSTLGTPRPGRSEWRPRDHGDLGGSRDRIRRRGGVEAGGLLPPATSAPYGCTVPLPRTRGSLGDCYRRPPDFRLAGRAAVA
jgi:hypothetical protein